MIDAHQLHGLDPRTWPWFTYVWVAFVLAGSVQSAWSWLQRKRAEKWAVEHGQIEWAQVKEPQFLSRRGHFVGEIEYTYSVWGTSQIGRYKRALPTEHEAELFVRALKGMSLVVRCNPADPSRSFVLESDVEVLLQQRDCASPLALSRPEDPLPQFLKPLLRPLVLASCVGLIVSLWVHVEALIGRPSDAFFWILHAGIFLVWFPAVLVARSLGGSINRNHFWKVTLKDSPAWMGYMVNGFMIYAVINFLVFFINVPIGPIASTPPIVWRGFSGHWMAFYSAAMAIHYAGLRRSSAR